MKPINWILNNRQRPGRAITCTGIAAVVAAGLTGAVFAQEGAEKNLQKELLQVTQDEVTLDKLPPPDERRVYVNDPRAFEVFTQQFVIDGNTGEYAGTLDTGLLPVSAVPPDGSKLYVADTHYSDYSYSKRNELIRIYNHRTLTEIGTIDIPEWLFLAMGVTSYTHISPDGRYLFFYQFLPNNGVGIVDLKAGKYLNTLDTPQCYYRFQ